MTTRTDPHRPGAIIPVDYEYVTSFSLSTTEDGWPVPAFNLDYVIEIRRTKKFSPVHSGTNQCDICGAYFIHGDVWRHIPSDEHITLGHICAEKYNLLADYADYKAERATAISKALRIAQRRESRRDAGAFLRANEGLSKALKAAHYITEDLRSQLIKRGSLSDAQVALAHKLAREVIEREEEENAPKVDAPSGRTVIEGVVLGTKHQEHQFGDTLKMIVKVATEAGSWKTYGTVPSAICFGCLSGVKGAKVRFTATVEPAKDDPSFSFFKRPTKASVIEDPSAKPCPLCAKAIYKDALYCPHCEWEAEKTEEDLENELMHKQEAVCEDNPRYGIGANEEKASA